MSHPRSDCWRGTHCRNQSEAVISNGKELGRQSAQIRDCSSETGWPWLGTGRPRLCAGQSVRFEFVELPGLVKPGLERAVEPEDRKPGFTRAGLHPVRLLAGGRRQARRRGRRSRRRWPGACRSCWPARARSSMGSAAASGSACHRRRRTRSSSPADSAVDVQPVGAGAVEQVAVGVVDGVGVGRPGADLGVGHRRRDDRREVMELGASVEQPRAVCAGTRSCRRRTRSSTTRRATPPGSRGA